VERGLQRRSGTILSGDPNRRRLGLLLSAESAAFRDAYTQTADSASLEIGEPQMEPVDYTCRLRYFEKVGDKYAVKQQLKDLVQFDFHNLKTEFLPRRNDMILCRNVMIYFDEAEQKRLIDKFWHCLNPGGYLFVGHAESLFGLTQKFKMIHENNGTAYQRLEART
jgi:chemotaxis methyl-accepting protein methylase